MVEVLAITEVSDPFLITAVLFTTNEPSQL